MGLKLHKLHLAFEEVKPSDIPQPVVLFEKLGRNGRVRTLAKFSSIDRLLLRAIQQQMDRILEETFSANSFTYRKNRGTLDAVKLAVEYIQQGKTWVTELDIHQFLCRAGLFLPPLYGIPPLHPEGLAWLNC